MKLVWSQRDLEDKRAILGYIEADDPHATILLDDRIRHATCRLIEWVVTRGRVNLQA